MIEFHSLDPRVQLADAVGLIPSFLSEHDPRGAVEQLNERYAHGGGWRDSKVGEGGWRMIDGGKVMKFPGDPPIHALAQAKLHERELVIVYESGWTAVVQDDASFRFARLD